jgi:ubiquinone/menaquinone biosynthesis C-methylase UbiE
MQPPNELVEKLAITKEITIMDFGCGPGYFTIELSKRAGKIVAVDLQQEMLQKAKSKCPTHR